MGCLGRTLIWTSSGLESPRRTRILSFLQQHICACSLRQRMHKQLDACQLPGCGIACNITRECIALSMRSAIPIPFLGFYPVTFPQSELDEAVNLLGSNSASDVQRFAVGPPKKTEPLAPRKDYETKNPAVLEDFGLTKTRPIGDLVLARLGDKGANVNLGLYVHTTEQWEWSRPFLPRTVSRSSWARTGRTGTSLSVSSSRTSTLCTLSFMVL